MAVDAITMSPKLDTVILFTGDGDFIPLVKYLQVHGGCQVEIASFGRSTSSKLKEAADHFLDLDEDPRRYLLNYRPVRSSRGGRPTRDPHSGVQVSVSEDSLAEQNEEDISKIGKITGVE